MKALVLIAHGSKKKQSNDEFRELVGLIREQNSDKYEKIIASFLEMESPSITNVVKELSSKKVSSITFYPFFLNSGKHVIVDIPDIVEELKKEYPNIEFKILPHFGQSSKIVSIISQDI